MQTPKETLTSRQRVERAIRHLPVDRMPIDLGVHFSTGISVVAYHNLRAHLGLSTDKIEMIDCVQGLARVDDDILDRFHVDTVLLNPPWPEPWLWEMRPGFRFRVPETFQPTPKNGGWEVAFKGESMYMPEGGYFFDGAWPDFYDMAEDDKLELFGRRAETLYSETDRFTLMMGFSGYFDGLDFACDMLTDPEDCKRLNEARLAENIAFFDKVNRRFGRYIGAVEVNSDLGMQTGPLCSPQSYGELCQPYLKRFCARVHETSDIQVFIHCCGSVEPMIPLLIDAGVDILNPVQISADHMDPAELKRKYGNDICFWGGGCDTQKVLWGGSAHDVRENVKHLAGIFEPGGGFVFNQVHNIMGNVPPENIVALFDAAYDAGTNRLTN
jgi:uroporphyrinogen decarboxylase